ncbi:MAG TPA: polysaccharide deacetylase family protein [Ensifer sp.]|jgi:peptidoglycan/xylan/chitin deacetylase (PgdA/CDA1 family)|uniref:polysaccharide deacetylase family protein n=1 Tax=Ensifer sp. TaxID=1872086 RepID=UPI002E106172|nr:polysaccharide deacetylase family protein [Ensifer sp.]
MGDGGGFVLSLDFELMWGVNDSRTIASHGRNVLGVRSMVPRMLDLLDRHELGCTWATVGFLFCDDRDELLARLPAIRPSYRNPRLSNYSYLNGVGADESKDPYHFAPSLIRSISRRPRQEIATHTFSHYYCLEEGHTREALAADLNAAIDVAAAKGYPIRTIVFPRNQVSAEALAVCREAGITVYRGTGRAAGGGGVARDREGVLRRAVRLADSYLEMGARRELEVERHDGMCNVPASLFLRPFSHRLAAGEGLKLQRILKAMRRAARRGGVFHLWFHPENFGVDQDENFETMSAIAAEAARLRERYGWPTLNMAEAAAWAERQDATIGAEGS